jgi:hypothetical protein
MDREIYLVKYDGGCKFDGERIMNIFIVGELACLI